MLVCACASGYPKGGLSCNLKGGGPWLGPAFTDNRTVWGHNHYVAAAASAYVAAHWPSESNIIWSGAEVGSHVQSGGRGFQQCKVATTKNPCAVREKTLHTLLTTLHQPPAFFCAVLARI